MYIKKVSYDKALDVAYTLAALGQRGAKINFLWFIILLRALKKKKSIKSPIYRKLMIMILQIF